MGGTATAPGRAWNGAGSEELSRTGKKKKKKERKKRKKKKKKKKKNKSKRAQGQVTLRAGSDNPSLPRPCNSTGGKKKTPRAGLITSDMSVKSRYPVLA